VQKLHSRRGESALLRLRTASAAAAYTGSMRASVWCDGATAFAIATGHRAIAPFTSLRHTGVSPEWSSTRQLQSMRSTKFFTSFTMYSS
jgi:hypothetical protein